MLRHRTIHAQMIECALAKHDLLKQDLADRLAVTPASISKWLRHDRPVAVPPKHWGSICQFLQIPMGNWIRAAEKDVPRDVQIYKRLVRSVTALQAWI